MTIIDVKKQINLMLREKYPPGEYEIYGVDTTEGYARPCFFVKLQPITMEAEGINRYNNELTCYIDYIQDHIDEVDMLQKVEEIRKMFELYFKVGDRAIDCSNFDFDFVGQKKNIVEISFDMQFYTAIEREETTAMMEHIEVRHKSS